MALYPKRVLITIADLYTMPGFVDLTRNAGQELKFTMTSSLDVPGVGLSNQLAVNLDPLSPSLTASSSSTSPTPPTASTASIPKKASNSNLLAVNLPVRFFTGLRLFSPMGVEVGLLCVFDFQAKNLTDRQQQSLEALGRQATGMLRSLQAFGANLAQPNLLEDIIPPKQNRAGFEKSCDRYRPIRGLSIS
ncbi:MAG: hypothetical protein HC795_16105 [Coleofasciculaceae cyanobacterium RL_1_1]|nr:hypothetical protein [Coleofasciculaceae cyanobacterium RL_1_1]